MATSIDPGVRPWTVEEACEVADLGREVRLAIDRLEALAERVTKAPAALGAKATAIWRLQHAAGHARHALDHLAPEAERAADEVEAHMRALGEFREGG